jgi:hypothetical protein
MTHATATLLMLTLAAFPAACQGGNGMRIVPVETVSDEGLPPAEVLLPPTPPLTVLDVPRTWTDGSWSVSGLMLAREQLREEEVAVTALVHTIYRCARENDAIEGEAAALAIDPEIEPTATTREGGCMLPHLYLVDSLRSPQRLLVTGYAHRHWEPQLRPGSRVTVHGLFSQRAAGFVSTEYGLIRASRFEGEGLTEPVVAPVQNVEPG